MGNLVFQATLGGQVNLVGPNTASTFNLNVPAIAGTLVTTGDTGTVTNTMLAGSIANAKLLNSSVTIGSTAVSLGSTVTAFAGITTLSMSGNLTLSGGTANGVAYLNGSNVVTTGSALTFDGSTLGLGNSPTAYKFEITTSGNNGLKLNAGTASADQLYFGNTGGVPAIGTLTSSALIFIYGGSEQMRLTSTGLGIGTSSPSQKLEVNGGVRVAGSATLGTALPSGVMSFESPVMRCYVGDGTGYSWAFSKRSASTTTDLMTLNDSGNLGLGVTANASAILDAQSTTKGVRFPNMTTTQKNAISSPAAGLVVFDTTLAKLCVYSGSAWQTITSI